METESNEAKMVRLLPRLLPAFQDPITVIELGMNDGHHTQLILSILQATGRPVRYIAVEADARLSPPDIYGVITVRAAIASKDGPVDFYLSDGVSETGMRYTGSSSLHPPGDPIKQYWPNMRFDRKIQVQGVTMDTLANQFGLGHIDFIWCDIQGGEDEAIRGGPVAFARAKFFFTEYADSAIYKGQATFQEIQAMLPGWAIHTDFGGDALLCNTALVPTPGPRPQTG